MMGDENLPLSGPNFESGRNVFEAIIISDSEDDQGAVSAPSESSRGADWELSSRDGYLAQNSTFSSATSLSCGSSVDLCMLKPELIASGSPGKRSFVHVSDSITNPSSNVDVIPLEEAQAPSGSGPTQQKTPTYIDVDSYSDVNYDSFVDSGQHDAPPLGRHSKPQANEEQFNPTAIRNSSSFTSPEVENISPPSASTRQGVPSLNNGPPGLLETIFASDFEEASSEAESRHETSSDDDRPFALAKAIATPLRELMRRPARSLYFNRSDSDASDSLADQNITFNLFSTGRRRSENDAPTSITGRRIRRQHSESSDGDDDKEPSPSPSDRSKEPVRPLSNMRLAVRSSNHEAHNRPLVASSSTDRTKASSTSLPKAPNGKARRVLVPETPSLPLVTISMRADANFLDRNKEHW
ncbi:hypothetical protein PILCRDRAFT_160183 [Piloderma croceum F 1598]|uniref:Uncharacterized protein n=1 Tax=Piloderma croceum (strain F 1598) TaxID=765440 RepID=A0A0C3GH84_PILCF|nr:hypothetical protein PILCRDRAFT_160183 [Piloderma croceum F 1598]